MEFMRYYIQEEDGKEELWLLVKIWKRNNKIIRLQIINFNSVTKHFAVYIIFWKEFGFSN